MLTVFERKILREYMERFKLMDSGEDAIVLSYSVYLNTQKQLKPQKIIYQIGWSYYENEERYYKSNYVK